MATVNLQPFQTIALPAGTPTQLKATTGHWWIQILNNGSGNVEIAQNGAMTSYFTLLPNLSVTPYVWGPDGIWVSSAAAGSISVALIPNTGTGAPTGAGAVVGGTGGAGQAQTPWLSNINGAGFTLADIGSIGVGVNTPMHAVDVAGDVNVTGQFLVNGVPLATGGGGSQTPWTANINAANFSLGGVSTIGIGGPAQPATSMGLSVNGSYSAQAVQINNTNPAGVAGIYGTSGAVNMTVGVGGATAVPIFMRGAGWVGVVGGPLLFATASTGRIYIDAASGYVGIGSNFTSPAYTLDVQGDINLTGVLRINGVQVLP